MSQRPPTPERFGGQVTSNRLLPRVFLEHALCRFGETRSQGESGGACVPKCVAEMSLRRPSGET
jgi:hypothetical protein